MEVEKEEKYISFKETDHEHPYEDPLVLKIEDIFGFMMCYRKPYNEDCRKSLKNYRNRLTKHCRDCLGFPNNCRDNDDDNGGTCRVYYLKEAMTREIKGTEICVRPMRGIRVRVIR